MTNESNPRDPLDDIQDPFEGTGILNEEDERDLDPDLPETRLADPADVVQIKTVWADPNRTPKEKSTGARFEAADASYLDEAALAKRNKELLAKRKDKQL